MKKTIVGFILIFIVAVVAIKYANKNDEFYNLKLEELKHKYAIKPASSVDHSKLAELQRDFATPQEVTEACNSCHTGRHREVMKILHDEAGIKHDPDLLQAFCFIIETSEMRTSDA